MEIKYMNLNQKIIKPKIGLLELAKSLGNISAACKTMGYTCSGLLSKTPRLAFIECHLQCKIHH